MKKKLNYIDIIKETVILTVAVAIIAAAVYFFLVPSHTSVSSISGLGIVLSNFVPLQLSAITMILNVVLLIIEPSGAFEAIVAVMKSFLRFPGALKLKYFGQALVRTAPLLLCALSVLFAYKVGMFNIGAAGQYCAGACAALYAALAWNMPWYVCILLGMLAGALLGMLAGALRTLFNVNVVISGIMLKKTKMFAGDPAPFVMELPAYHWPTVSNVLRSMWERGWSFIKKAGTIILMSTIVLWFLMNFGWVDGSFGMLEAEQLNDSILASIGSVIAPLFAPLGWGDWKMAVAAVSGLIAKENVVGTFGILFGFGEVAEDGAEIWGQLAGSLSTVAAYSFLVFNLLCAPCFAAMGAIKREMNNTKWFFTAIGYQTLLAYVVSLCIYQIGNLFIGGGFGIGTVVAVLLIIGFVYLLVRPYKESATLSVSTNKMFSK